MPRTDIPKPHELLNTADAQKWAEAFCAKFEVKERDMGMEPDPRGWEVGLMIGWFSNAIRTGQANATD